MTARFRISASRFFASFHPLPWGALALSVTLMGCSSPRDTALDEFVRWYDGAKAQAQAGAMGWSELYKQSFDRLTALPPSLQQDTRLENTVLLLSVARQLESNEISPQQFALQRDDIESQLQARLR